MACKQVGSLLMVVVAIGLGWSIASATEFVVGGGDGWNLGVDYTAWARDKVFRVGDSLVFKYKTPTHDVVKVDGPNFDECTVPDGNEPLTTGNDVIPLKSLGEKLYICSKGNHCGQGMKLAVKVVEDSGSPNAEAPNAAPPASSSARTAMFWYQNFMAMAVVVAMAVAIMV